MNPLRTASCLAIPSLFAVAIGACSAEAPDVDQSEGAYTETSEGPEAEEGKDFASTPLLNGVAIRKWGVRIDDKEAASLWVSRDGAFTLSANGHASWNGSFSISGSALSIRINNGVGGAGTAAENAAKPDGVAAQYQGDWRLSLEGKVIVLSRSGQKLALTPVEDK